MSEIENDTTIKAMKKEIMGLKKANKQKDEILAINRETITQRAKDTTKLKNRYGDAVISVGDHQWEMDQKEKQIKRQKTIIEALTNDDDTGINAIKARILEWVEAMSPTEIIEAAKVWPTL